MTGENRESRPVPQIEYFPEVPAQELEDLGIIEALRTPTTENYHDNIPWDRISEITVGGIRFASEGSAHPIMPHIRLHFKRGYKRPYVDFSVYFGGQDGNFEVATVSGAQAPHAALNEEQSRKLTELYFKMLDRQ